MLILFEHCRRCDLPKICPVISTISVVIAFLSLLLECVVLRGSHQQQSPAFRRMFLRYRFSIPISKSALTASEGIGVSMLENPSAFLLDQRKNMRSRTRNRCCMILQKDIKFCHCSKRKIIHRNRQWLSAN